MSNLASVRNLCGLTLAALVLMVPAAAQSPYGYTAIDLGTLGGSFSGGQAINASGQVAGSSKTAGDATSHAVIWTGTTTTEVGAFGGFSSGANGINDSGQIAGDAGFLNNFVYHAFRYSNGAMTDLGTLGGLQSRGAAINNSGQIAGYADLPGEDCIMRPSGQERPLPTLAQWEGTAAPPSASMTAGRQPGITASIIPLIPTPRAGREIQEPILAHWAAIIATV